MTKAIQESTVVQAVALLNGYGFDLKGNNAEELVSQWLNKYKAIWVRFAVIEALYQGRYKAVSVEQILSFWLRRGNPNFHYNGEFERLICSKLPQYMATVSESFVENSKENFSPLSLNNESTKVTQLENIFISSIRDQQNIMLATSVSYKPSKLALDNSQLLQTLHLGIKPENQAKQIDQPHIPYKANWSRCNNHQVPIHQFTPLADVSDFFVKLKAVAQQVLT
jgi:hypothetical protein